MTDPVVRVGHRRRALGRLSFAWLRVSMTRADLQRLSMVQPTTLREGTSCTTQL